MAEVNGGIRVFLRGYETETPTVSDTGLFLYDFSTLYELAILALDPRYDNYHFSRFSLYRHNRPVAEDEQLRVESIRQESPLEIAATIAAFGAAGGTVIGAFWALAQLVGYTYNFPLNRRKLELEVAKLKRELAEKNTPEDPLVLSLSEAMDRVATKAGPLVGVTARRLARSPIQLEEVDVSLGAERQDVTPPTLEIAPDLPRRLIRPPDEGEAS